MATKTKKPLSIRITDDGRTFLEQLAEAMGISYTAVVETAIRDLAERKGVKSPQSSVSRQPAIR